MGVRVDTQLCSSNILDYIELSPDLVLLEIVSHRNGIKKSLKELNLRDEYGINVYGNKKK